MIEKLQSAKIYFGLPSYDGKVNVIYHKSMLDTQRLLDRSGIVSGTGVLNGDCYVQRARNEIAEAFLRSGYTHLFFIDSDMGWRSEDVLRLVMHDKDMVVGAYHLKTDEGEKKYMIEPYSNDGKFITENGLIKVRSAATGFMCIKKSVFEQMINAYPDIEYKGEDGRPFWAFFHCSLRKFNGVSYNTWFGEDIDFCHKWVACGGEIWCEPNCTLQHSGTKIWTCNMSEGLDKRGGI